MNRMRNHLLSSTGLSSNHHCCRATCHLGNLLIDVTHLPRIPNNIAELIALPKLLTKLVIFRK